MRTMRTLPLVVGVLIASAYSAVVSAGQPNFVDFPRIVTPRCDLDCEEVGDLMLRERCLKSQAENRCNSTPGSARTDRNALEALYRATNGSNWANNGNWLSEEPLHRWAGVTTNGDGRVIGLRLRNLIGPIPRDIGRLTALLWLHFEDNELTGSIPTELGNLRSLRVLRLTRNKLSGRVPTALANLSSLEDLELDLNMLSGPIPAEIGNLINLKVLALNDNTLSGPIPVELGNLANVERVYLFNNTLSGPIPTEFGNLAKLEVLVLSTNALSGSLPRIFGGLSRLWWLDIARTGVCVPDDAAMRAWSRNFAFTTSGLTCR